MVNDLLDNTCIICDSVKLLSDIELLGIEKFSETVHKFVPKYLFKYFPNTRKWIKEEKKYRNFSYEALVNGTVYLQDADKFDDCFDCAIDLDWEKFLRNRLIQYCDYFDVEYDKADTIDNIISILSAKFLKYNSLEEILNEKNKYEDIILKNSIEIFVRILYKCKEQGYELGVAIINEIGNEYENFIKSFSKFKMTCFSTSPFLNRMWSAQYGNDNKGFCIEYEINLTSHEEINLFENIYPVIYSQQRNDVLPISGDCDKAPTSEFLWQMYFNGLLRKSLHWQDQKEWRLILLDSLIERNPLPFFKIKKVYLGNKMPSKDRLKIIKYCRKHSIEYVGLVRDNNSFNLIECEGDCYLCKKVKK